MNTYLLGAMAAVVLAGCLDTTARVPSVGVRQLSNAGKSDQVDRSGSAREQGKVRILLAVTGTLPGGGTFAGRVRIREFGTRQGEVTVAGVLTGVGKVNGLNRRIEDVGFTTPVVITEAAETVSARHPPALDAGIAAQAMGCPSMIVDPGPIFLDQLRLRLDLSPVRLDLTGTSGAGSLVGNQLCLIVKLLDLPVPDVTELLSLVVSTLNGLLA